MNYRKQPLIINSPKKNCYLPPMCFSSLNVVLKDLAASRRLAGGFLHGDLHGGDDDDYRGLDLSI